MAVLVLLGVGQLDDLPYPWTHLIRLSGIVAFLAGVGLRAWTLRSRGDAYAPDLRIKANHRLVTTGAYALVRHPFYLSAVLLLLGAGLGMWNGLVLSLNLPLWIVLYQRIRLEEEMLLSFFGSAYAGYRENVPAIFPRAGGQTE